MTLQDELLEQLGEPGVEQVAGMLGAGPGKARDVLLAVTGAVVGGLARNTRHPDGADALRGALDDHVDADPFNGDVASLTRDGHGILAHVLGGQGTEHVATRLARLCAVDTGRIMKLLPLVAPMVLSLLADRAAERGMDASAVADDLDRERAAIPAGLAQALDGVLDEVFGGGYGAFGGLGAYGELEPGESRDALEQPGREGARSALERRARGTVDPGG
ncbi:MAG TPA: DUF937 domain-containing protein [Nonomuraea sp.]|nr:DUF937 domain-containing protein [Nonomuraea sp.]